MARLKGGPTQEEVLAVALQKLELGPDDRVLDLGCGTGSVSIAAAARVAEVVAIDRRPEAIAHAMQRAAEVEAGNIRFVEGEASNLLPALGRFDAAFVGGSRDLDTLLGTLADRVRRRIVVNAVLVETLSTALSRMNSLGIFEEAVHVQCSRAVPLAGSVFFRPIDPVYIIVGRGRCS
ncbi:MAG TPA: precorrin-6Y C5,15-methyltransferase (decarboxylating) subunit CbiT [Methanoregulaceae archaeon]|nr:precorrin-6Y C5,15-methyltransferase (decarboxylating) subunit CbiT [Methanoregulaceae archaeon]HQJ86936.1 precorrin-6Y C5,15-methyltransferase (decarboxylating) subunit CbiT [Methanoregulaceae archaeon]